MTLKITPDPKLFEIKKTGRKREVTCICGEVVLHSIVPHLRKKHAEIWEKWCQVFINLSNDGLTDKKIMEEFASTDGKFLFSWTVIEGEKKRIVERDGLSLKVKEKSEIKTWEPKEFELEDTTLWSFPRRGSWAVHQSDYRGNWPPQVPRNLILKYTKPMDTVLDPFVGGGTTLIESWILGRKSVGIDISPHAINTASARLREMKQKSADMLEPLLDESIEPLLIKADSRKIVEILEKKEISENMIDLVCAHPPYLNMLKYTATEKSDLSRISKINEFIDEVRKIASQLFKVLKEKGKCTVLIGDIRKKGKVVPLGNKVMTAFCGVGFDITEIIIKQQHRDKSTEFYYGKSSIDYLLAHEYLYVFEKPIKNS